MPKLTLNLTGRQYDELRKALIETKVMCSNVARHDENGIKRNEARERAKTIIELEELVEKAG